MLASLSNLLGPNLLLLVGIVVLIFGGKKLPELARGIRTSIKEFKRGKDDADQDQAPPASATDETKRAEKTTPPR